MLNTCSNVQIGVKVVVNYCAKSVQTTYSITNSIRILEW